MSWLAPFFLIGLAALAVPILIHLIQRERRRVVPFPSLMFVRRVPFRSVRRRRIRHLPLLLLRLAALLLIVAAFARPFVRTADTAALGDGPREVVILLDRSLSMGYADRWDRARDAAHASVGALGAGDRVSLIAFSTGAELEVRSTADRSPVTAAIDRILPGDGATLYGPALKLAASVLVQSALPGREVILISDFQRTGWNRGDDARLPEGTTLTPVMLSDADGINASVSGVSFARSTFSGQERVAITAAVANHGTGRMSDLPVTLEIEGRPLQTVQVSIEPDTSAAVTFDPFTMTEGNTRGIVRAEADLLPADDRFHFAIAPGRRVPVLVIERPGAPPETSLYLSRSLGIGDAPGFDVQVRSLDRVTPADLESPDLVVLNDVTPPPALAARLGRLAAAGGGLLVVLGEHGGWPDDVPEVLPGRIGAIVDRTTDRGGTLGFLDFSHGILEIFRAPRSGDFAATRFLRYRATTGVDADAVLARFDDGGVALAGRTVERGRVLMWTSTLDTFWNDLALKPVYLPFIHQVARHLTRYVAPVPWFTVGQAVDLAAAYGAAGDRLGTGSAQPFREGVVLTPSGRRLTLAADDGRPVLELDEQGFYEVRLRDDEGDWPLTLAANVDSAESDLTPFDPEDLIVAVGGRGDGPDAGAVAGMALTPEDQERRQSFWWYLLFAGAALLALETALSNRLSRTGSAQTGAGVS